LAVAKEAEAEYEWIQHVEIAKAVGATDAQIAAVAETDLAGADSGAADAALDARQRTAIAFAAAVVHSPHVSDELFERVRADFPDREIVELLPAIGDYLMLARVMTVLQIDLDEPVGDAVLGRSRDGSADRA